MKYGVSKQVLLITAGIVWVVAGANVLRIGVGSWGDGSEDEFFKVVEATVVFLLFFVFVFRKLYYKHTKRIREKQSDKNCPFSFFDLKGWLVMTVMVAAGVITRMFQLLPDTFISVFYTGLSIALIATGLLFIRYGWRQKRPS